jgi:hypothetical protein
MRCPMGWHLLVSVFLILVALPSKVDRASSAGDLDQFSIS